MKNRRANVLNIEADFHLARLRCFVTALVRESRVRALLPLWPSMVDPLAVINELSDEWSGWGHAKA
jgi:hypothetical protein